MSERFFHVDQRGELSAGTEIGRDHLDAGTAEERALLADLFDGGVAPHGHHYCTTDLYADDTDRSWSISCELLFELVRRERFRWRPSRFQTVFGFTSRGAADRFVADYVDGGATLYEVTAPDGFEADVGLVDAPTLPEGLRRAHYYWEGLTDREDPLWEVLLEPPVIVERAVETVQPGEG